MMLTAPSQKFRRLVVTFDLRDSPEDFTQCVRPWILERNLTLLRATGILLLFLWVVLSNSSSRGTATLAFAGILGAVNAFVLFLLQKEPDEARLHLAQRAGAAVELGAIAGILLIDGGQSQIGVGLMLIMLLLIGVRYRLRGVVVGTIVSWIILGIRIGYVLLNFGSHATIDIVYPAAETLVVLTFGALSIGSIVAVADACHAWERSRLEDERRRSFDQLRSYQREANGLSKREWEVLNGLAGSDTMTYDQIGRRLHISAETVKTHVYRIGIKFGVSGRTAVVAAARERGIIAEVEARSEERTRAASSGEDSKGMTRRMLTR